MWSECVRFRAEMQGPLIKGCHEKAGHGSLPLRHRRLLLVFVASIERVLDDVSAADNKRVEELGFYVRRDAIPTLSKANEHGPDPPRGRKDGALVKGHQPFVAVHGDLEFFENVQPLTQDHEPLSLDHPCKTAANFPAMRLSSSGWWESRLRRSATRS